MNAYEKAMNRLAKWRMVFAGWQLGTRADTDPEAQALRDHREATLLLRAEVNALTTLLIEKKVFTVEELQCQCVIEAGFLQEAMERQFPGFKATDVGMTMDVQAARETTKNWKP